MIRECAEKFVKENPGWDFNEDEDGDIDLTFNHKTKQAIIIDGYKCYAQIMLIIDQENFEIRSRTSAKLIDHEENEEFTPSPQILKEIIPIIDKSLLLFSKYIPDDFKVIPFSAIKFSFTDINNFLDNYYQYINKVTDNKNESGDTELIKLVRHIGSANHHMAVVTKLLDFGCDPDICNNVGESAMSILIENKQDLLIAHIEKIKLDQELDDDETYGPGL